jgi:hypothetical protein
MNGTLSCTSSDRPSIFPSASYQSAQAYLLNFFSFRTSFFSSYNDEDMLFDIIIAAHYLQIKPLVEVRTKTVANKIKGMNPTGIQNVPAQIHGSSESTLTLFELFCFPLLLQLFGGLGKELDRLPNLHAVVCHLPDVAYLYGILVVNCLPDEMKHRLFKQFVPHTNFIDRPLTFLRHELVRQALRSLISPASNARRTYGQDRLAEALSMKTERCSLLVDAIYCSHELQPAIERDRASPDICSFNGLRIRDIPNRHVDSRLQWPPFFSQDPLITQCFCFLQRSFESIRLFNEYPPDPNSSRTICVDPELATQIHTALNDSNLDVDRPVQHGKIR